MAAVTRTRTLPEINWEKEDALRRYRRRRRLASLDALLTQLEECNLRGGRVTETLRHAIARSGVGCPSSMNAPDAIEAIFVIQERFMLQQLNSMPLVEERQRRIA